MNRKLTAAAVLVAAISVMAASCTLPAPATRTWKVKAESVQVIDQEDFDAGDEPYAIQVGFRSKLGVPNSAAAFVVSQCNSGAFPMPDPTSNVGTPGTVVPVGGADITFPEAQNLDIGDVLLETAPLEIFGTMSFVMERDVLIGTCAWTETINAVLPGILRDSLNLLIGQSPIPPTEQQLVDLVVGLLDDFLAVIPGAIAIAVEGVGASSDDLLGVALQIHLPTAGAFTNLLDLGLNLAGIDNGQLDIPDLPTTIKFRIGKLLPSSASFTFTDVGREHIFTSSVGT
jgi:hypothetical protein